MKTLLLGGTSDSTAILALYHELGKEVITSVVTDYGRHLAAQYGQAVHQGRLTAKDMITFVKENHISHIVDATHPFADLVSREAIAAAEEVGIPYLRFERQATSDLSGAIVVTSTEEAIVEITKRSYRTVYLATGSKTLPLFVKGLSHTRIVARVLPTSEVVLACEQLGLLADQIDAIKAPFSKECNKELVARSQADVFVSKESGSIGGIREKIEGCLELGIDCIIIARPSVHYPAVVSTLEELEVYLKAL